MHLCKICFSGVTDLKLYPFTKSFPPGEFYYSAVTRMVFCDLGWCVCPESLKKLKHNDASVLEIRFLKAKNLRLSVHLPAARAQFHFRSVHPSTSPRVPGRMDCSALQISWSSSAGFATRNPIKPSSRLVNRFEKRPPMIFKASYAALRPAEH